MWDKSAFLTLYVLLSVASSSASPLSRYGMVQRAELPRVFRNDTTTATSVTSQEKIPESFTTPLCLTCTPKTESTSSTPSPAGEKAPTTVSSATVSSSVTSSITAQSSKQESFSTTTTVTIVWPPEPPVTDGSTNSNAGTSTSTPSPISSPAFSSESSTIPATSTAPTSSTGRPSATSEFRSNEFTFTSLPETTAPAQNTPPPTPIVVPDTDKLPSSSSVAQSTSTSTGPKAPETSAAVSPPLREETRSSSASTTVQEPVIPTVAPTSSSTQSSTEITTPAFISFTTIQEPQSSTPTFTPTASRTQTPTEITIPVFTSIPTFQESQSATSSFTSTNDSPNTSKIPVTSSSASFSSSTFLAPTGDGTTSVGLPSNPSSVSSSLTSETSSSIVIITNPIPPTSEALSSTSTVTSTISTPPVAESTIPIGITLSGSTGPVTFELTLPPSETSSVLNTLTLTSTSVFTPSIIPTTGSSSVVETPVQSTTSTLIPSSSLTSSAPLRSGSSSESKTPDASTTPTFTLTPSFIPSFISSSPLSSGSSSESKTPDASTTSALSSTALFTSSAPLRSGTSSSTSLDTETRGQSTTSTLISTSSLTPSVPLRSGSSSGANLSSTTEFVVSSSSNGASRSTRQIPTPIPTSGAPSNTTKSGTSNPVTRTSVAGITPTGAFGTGFFGTGRPPAEAILEPTKTPGKNSTNGEGKNGHSSAASTKGPSGSGKGLPTSAQPDSNTPETGIAPPAAGSTESGSEEEKKKNKDGDDNNTLPTLTTSQTAGIAIGTTACALIALVAVLFIIRRRRNQQKDRHSTGSVYPEVAYLYDPQIPKDDERGPGGAGGATSRRMTSYDAVPTSPQWQYSVYSQPYYDSRSPTPLLPNLPPQYRPEGPVFVNPAAAEYPPLSPYRTKMPELTPLPAVHTNAANNPFEEEEDIILDIEPGTETPDSLVVLAVPPPTPRISLTHRYPPNSLPTSTPGSTPPQNYSPPQPQFQAYSLPQPQLSTAVAIPAPSRQDITTENYGPPQTWEVNTGFVTQPALSHRPLPSTMLAHSPPPDSVIDDDWTSISFPSPNLPPALPPKPLKIAPKKAPPPPLSLKQVGHGAGQSLLLSGVGLPLTLKHERYDGFGYGSSETLDRGLGLEIAPMGKVYGRGDDGKGRGNGNGVFSPQMVDDEWGPNTDPVVLAKRSNEVQFARWSLIGKSF